MNNGYIRKSHTGEPTNNPAHFGSHNRSEPEGSLGAKVLNDGARPDSQSTGLGSLSDLMDFDHVITVTPGGVVYDGPPNLWAPDAYEPEIDATELDGWKLLTGYSGQHGYRGPWMHQSELIAGGIADDILNEPGHYVAIYSQHEPEESDGETVMGGWAIAYRPLETEKVAA